MSVVRGLGICAGLLAVTALMMMDRPDEPGTTTVRTVPMVPDKTVPEVPERPNVPVHVAHAPDEAPGERYQCGPVLRLAEQGELSALAEAEACRNNPPAEDTGPVALLHAAAASHDPAQFEAAAAAAAASGDPDAQLLLGQLLLGQGEDPIDGLAWMLVGCPDCTVDDPRLGFAQCVEFDTCIPGMPFVDWLAATEGWEPVQEAQARAASLKALYD